MPLTRAAIRNIELLERLGEGGMGEVWLGRDARLGRTVAVKAVRSERRLDEKARSRFLREAQILSQLDHPNICRLYDYVEENGAQYLVLEHVTGRTLGQRLKEGLSEEEKLAVSIQLASALTAAHSMSVVHRDLKPSNVMVADDGTVKILDFGLARPSLAPSPLAAKPAAPAARSSDDLETSATVGLDGEAVTRIGDLLGTPRYMSPEQARGEPVTAASDVYALGLLLQEIFTGTPGYSAELTPPELQAKAQWGDRDPAQCDDPAVAELIDRLTRLQPADRPTATAAEDELFRIRDAPKVRRARRARLAGIALLAVLTLALALLSVRLNNEVDRSRRAARVAEETTDFLVSLFDLADPYRRGGTEVTARELLDRGAEEIRGRFGEDPRTRARLLETLGTIYRRLGAYGQGAKLLEEAMTVEQAESDDVQRLRLLLDLADARFRDHDLEATETLLEQALGLAEGALGDRRRVADVLHQLLLLRKMQGRLEEAEALGRRSLAIQEELLGPEHPATGFTMGMLGLVLLDAGRYEEAKALIARSLRIVEKHHPLDHPEVLQLKANLSTAHKELGELAEAEALLQEVLPRFESRMGSDHPDVATVYNDLGVVLLLRERYDEAEAAYRRALEIAEGALGEDHPLVGIFLANLAEARALGGRPEDAEPSYERALAVLRTALGDHHPALADPLRGSARVEAELGRPEEAERRFLEAIAIRTESQGPDHPEIGRTLAQLGQLQLGQGRTEDAMESFRRALAILEPVFGPENDEIQSLRVRLDSDDFHLPEPAGRGR